jgi:hypothetical protein
MLKTLAEETYKSLYHLPPNAKDLEEFAAKVLNKVFQELEKNKAGVAWNSGFDSVVFYDKTVDGQKSIKQIKEEFLGQESDAGNPAISQGTGISGDIVRDSQVRSADQLS